MHSLSFVAFASPFLSAYFCFPCVMVFLFFLFYWNLCMTIQLHASVAVTGGEGGLHKGSDSPNTAGVASFDGGCGWRHQTSYGECFTFMFSYKGRGCKGFDRPNTGGVASSDGSCCWLQVSSKYLLFVCFSFISLVRWGGGLRINRNRRSLLLALGNCNQI